MDAELGRTTGTATSSDRRGIARRVSTETAGLAKSGSREPYDDDRR
jgi:hypothetical protein